MRAGAGAREGDPAIEPLIPPEVKARAQLLEDTFDNHEGPLKRGLQGRERDVLLRWARLARNGALVPLDEIVQYARYLLAKPMRDGELPATLMAIESQVMTLARAPATNGHVFPPSPADMADFMEANGATDWPALPEAQP